MLMGDAEKPIRKMSFLRSIWLRIKIACKPADIIRYEVDGKRYVAIFDTTLTGMREVRFEVVNQVDACRNVIEAEYIKLR